MSDNAGRRRLARAAARLAVAGPFAGRMPPLALFTDDARLADPVAAARALPRGSLVVLRARDAAKRRALALSLQKAARERALVLLVAGDPGLARAIRARGIHFAERDLALAARWRARWPSALITASVHSQGALLRARACDALFLAPVFPTGSHPGQAALGPLRASLVARAARLPVYALGGVGPANARRLAPVFAGIAAVSALVV